MSSEGEVQSCALQSHHVLDSCSGEQPSDREQQPDAQPPLSADDDDNFKVVIRVRPPLPRELADWQPYQNTVQVSDTARVITISENLDAYARSGGSSSDGLLHTTYRFTFDHVFAPAASQADVYRRAALPAITSALKGYNAAIIAYGQTGTGKTYTMEGPPAGEARGSLRGCSEPGAPPDGRGIVPRAISDIFATITSEDASHQQYLVRVSYLQIYNEVISDLLKTDRCNLVVREDRRRGVYVDKLSEWVVRNEREIQELMARGGANRTTGATKLNDVSSRSHAVFILIVEQSQSNSAGGDGRAAAGPARSVRVGKLNLVDLAGSERVHVTGATGRRLEESKNINQSLSALGNVIAALTDRNARAHIPYRDSKLTRILEDSLGGNCKTTMICMVSPALDAFAESVSTLKFANRAKTIRNQATVNEDLDQRTLLRKYERELKRLRCELQTRSKQLVDKRHLLQVDEERRRAEADKLAAIVQLEQRSKEFMREKSQKLALEEKITRMQGQLLNGGGSPLHEHPVLKRALEAEHAKVRKEYDARFQDLERKRMAMEGDKAQAESYKDMVLKQRDIMLALTRRLHDRDEEILQLKEEVEAYERTQRRLEDELDQKTADVIALRRAALQQVTASAQLEHADLRCALGSWADGSTNGLDALPLAGREGPAEAEGSAPASPTGKGSVGSLAEAGDESPWTPAPNGGFVPAAGSRARRPGAQDLGRRLREAELQVANLAAENHQLSSALEASDRSSATHQTDMDRLLEQTKSQAKERTALKTILDEKLRAYTTEMAHSFADLRATGMPVPRDVEKKLGGMVRLIDATISAMQGN